MLRPLRWLGKNFSTLLLAFFLALIVWVSAVISADPNLEKPMSKPVTIDYIGKKTTLKLMGDYPTNVVLTLMAPQSVWERLNKEEDLVYASVDLSGVEAGEYTLPVQAQIDLDLVRLISIQPSEVTLKLENLVTQSLSVNLLVSGEPPLGYQADAPLVEPGYVTVSGPESLVNKVKEIRAALDITGLVEKTTRSLTVSAVDENGRVVSGVTLSPNSVTVAQPVNLLGGYRNVVVKVVTSGVVSSGYRLTNYFVAPSSVVVFSTDPLLVNSLPGYVETKPLNLIGADDDFEVLLELDLPQGVTAVADSKVLVQVSIASITSSLAISLPVEITGLSPMMDADISPATVDVLLSGPVPVLNALQPSDIRVKVDLSDYAPGTYQIIPIVDFLPGQVERVSVLPATVEVIITLLPTATPTPTRTPEPTLDVTPTPSITPTSQP